MYTVIKSYSSTQNLEVLHIMAQFWYLDNTFYFAKQYFKKERFRFTINVPKYKERAIWPNVGAIIQKHIEIYLLK